MHTNGHEFSPIIFIFAPRQRGVRVVRQGVNAGLAFQPWVPLPACAEPIPTYARGHESDQILRL